VLIIENYGIDSNQILHSNKDHQMPFLVDPNMRITNPRWQMAAISEKSKNPISQQRFDRLSRNLIIWRSVTFSYISLNRFDYFPCIMTYRVTWVYLRNKSFIVWLADWKSQAVFPRAGPVKVWVIGLFQSHTKWRWQKGSLSNELYCTSVIISHSSWNIDEFLSSI